MTANERLRELLDERGVEWTSGDTEVSRNKYTHFCPDAGMSIGVWESGDGKLGIDAHTDYRFTPEQAIAATIGSCNCTNGCTNGERTGTLTAERVMAIAGKHQPDYCSDTHVCFDWQAIADELNATLGDVPRLPHFWTHDGALHVELPKLPESISVRLPAQRDRELGSARVWQYTLSDADATPTRQDDGTCHDTGTFKSWGLFTCSNCSIVIPLNAAKDAPEIGKVVPLRFCPNCGRKVVDE